jgi:16S rRNA (cytidine1402-2'-O)-methyltransferase
MQRRTVILYEAPHRLHRTLIDLSVACGPERQVALCRELTKIHEEVWRGSFGEAVDHYGTHEPQGEFVLVLHGAPDAPPPTADDIDRLLLAELASGASTKDASTAVSHILGVPKKNVYNRAVELTNSRKIAD